MRGRWYLLVLLPLLVAVALAGREFRETPLPGSVRSEAQFIALLDTVVPTWQARDRVPGVCIGMVSGDASGLRCYGKARADGDRPVDGASRFGVASVSKSFTALAVLTLAGRGAFALDDPVERHLRTWRFPNGPFDGSAVTIRELLTHTAGVGVPSYGGAGSVAAGETTLDVLDGRGAGREPVRLIASPGSGFSYSGGGYMVLQLLVEDVSGEPFDRFVVENVFQPLGMTDTSFSWGATRAGDAAGHDVAGRRLAPHLYGAAMAPGAMVTTGDDMLRFVSAFAASRIGTLLGWPAGQWDRFVAPDQGGYGMALTIARANGHLLLGHAGTTMGYNAGFTAMPSERAGWFVLENGNAGPFLKADLDRLFMEWKTGSIDPRYRVMQLMRAFVVFLGAVLTGLGGLTLAVFVVSLGFERRAWVGASRLGSVGKAWRLLLAVSLPAIVVLWIVFFHTEAFYPAFTTAWLPFAFRYVTLGAVLLALRAALSCAFVRERAVVPEAHGSD